MHYDKPPISFQQQVEKLKTRGMQFKSESTAIQHLTNISYYRLRAYTYPFQDNNDPNHPFKVSITFEQIIDLYQFDRKLCSLLFNALEKIEIALRTQIIYQWGIVYGSHWQIDSTLYRDQEKFVNQINSLRVEIGRSHETFIDHYLKTYLNPSDPPSWMSLEVSSFGLLSQLFYNLRKGKEKMAVTKHFGLNDVAILENWMHCFSNIRNICAHHSRLWNRRFTAHITLPNNPQNLFIKDRSVYPYKLYAAICCIQYMLNSIFPGNRMGADLIELIKNCPFPQEKEMGFPVNWEMEPFWQLCKS